MARSHARLKVSIHRDADWLCRSPEAKLTYYTLLSDPRLTIAGVMELAERRWGRMTGYPQPTLAAALVELEEHGYVVVDGSTDELLIRTLPKHDLDPNRLNRNIGKGFWGAWGVIESPILRSVIVHELDEALWAGLAEHAPADATQTRRSARLEPGRYFSVATGSAPEDKPRSEPPLSSHLSPTTCRQPAEQRQQRIVEACNALATERAALRDDIGPNWIPATSRGIASDHHQALHAFLTANPAATTNELVDVIEGAAPKRKPEPVNPSSFLRPVHEVVPLEPVADREEALSAIAAIRGDNTFLSKPKEPA